jgi:hypothetical protein
MNGERLFDGWDSRGFVAARGGGLSNVIATRTCRPFATKS